MILRAIFMYGENKILEVCTCVFWAILAIYST